MKLLALLALLAIPCHADTMSPVWDVTGTITMTGNDACGGPCVENVALTFQTSYKVIPDGFGGSYIDEFITNLTEDWSGALGTFSRTGPGGHFGCCPTYFPLNDQQGDELDIVTYSFQAFPTSISTTTPFFGAELYSCADRECGSEFIPPSFAAYAPGQLTALFLTENSSFTVTAEDPPIATPEPSSIWLVLLGLPAVVLFKRVQPRRLGAIHPGPCSLA